jgi:amino acid transporter
VAADPTGARGRPALHRRDVLLYCVSAILLLDTVAASSSIGASSVGWWLILGVAFFLPFALVSIELGCAYPDPGGIYAWVHRAFGGRWAGRVAWFYWVNVAAWCPSIYILFTGTLARWLGLEVPLWSQVFVGLVLTWITVAVNCLALDVGKWVPNAGAVLKVLVFVGIVVGALLHAADTGIANDLSLARLVPTWDSGLQFVPVIVYGMLGFELVCAASDELEDPPRNLPRAILGSGLIVLLCYVAATVAVLVAIPVERIDLVDGLVDTFERFFGALPGGSVLVGALTLASLYTFFSNGATWALGANRAAAAAAADGQLPEFLGRTDPDRHTPVGAALALGLASSAILLVYATLATADEDLFWSLFAFSGVIFLLPYVAMMLAFVRLRRADPGTFRPFRAAPPGLAEAAALLCTLILLFSVVLFVWIPGEGVQWSVLLGAATLVALGEILAPSVMGHGD